MMKRYGMSMILMAGLMLLTAMASAQPNVWTFDRGVQGWQGMNMTVSQALRGTANDKGRMIGKIIGNPPASAAGFALNGSNVDATNNKQLAIAYKLTGDGGNTGLPGHLVAWDSAGNLAVWYGFTFDSGDQVLRLDLSGVGGWNGTLGRIELRMPSDNPALPTGFDYAAAEFEVDWIGISNDAAYVPATQDTTPPIGPKVWTFDNSVQGFTGVNMDLSFALRGPQSKNGRMVCTYKPAAATAEAYPDVSVPASEMDSANNRYLSFAYKITGGGLTTNIPFAFVAYADTTLKIYSVYTLPTAEGIARIDLSAVSGWTDGGITRFQLRIPDPNNRSGFDTTNAELEFDWIAASTDPNFLPAAQDTNPPPAPLVWDFEDNKADGWSNYAWSADVSPKYTKNAGYNVSFDKGKMVLTHKKQGDAGLPSGLDPQANPQLTSPFGLNFAGSKYNYLLIAMETTGLAGATTGSTYFVGFGADGGGDLTASEASLLNFDNAFTLQEGPQIYKFNLASSAGFSGAANVNYFRFDLPRLLSGGSFPYDGVTYKIDWIALASDSNFVPTQVPVELSSFQAE